MSEVPELVTYEIENDTLIHGLRRMPHYQNQHWAGWPGNRGYPQNKCGPAAVLTMLHHRDGSTFTWTALEYIANGMSSPGADLAQMGTTYDGMQRMVTYFGGTHSGTELTSHGRGFEKLDYEGIDNAIVGLKQKLQQEIPCVILLDWGAADRPWGGHWTVAFAYNREYLYVTNWDNEPNVPGAQFELSWNEIPKLMSGMLTVAGGMSGRGNFQFLTLR